MQIIHKEFGMKRVTTLMAAAAVLSLVLGLSSISFAQGETPAPRPHRAERIFKALDPDNTGKITREAFMAEAQKRAMLRWERLDPNGKGFVTREDFKRGRPNHHRGPMHGKPAAQQ